MKIRIKSRKLIKRNNNNEACQKKNKEKLEKEEE